MAESDVNVRGMGWLSPLEYGCAGLGTRIAYHGAGDLGSLRRDPSVFAGPVKDFARYDAVSRSACYAVALALRDAGLRGAPGEKLDAGLLGTSAEGCLASNRDFFTDYVRCGRTLARGNLFLYTLPTSPLAEAAIHFGLQGPVFAASGPAGGLAALMQAAAGMVRRGEAAAMVVLKAEPSEAAAFALGPGAAGSLCGLAEAAAIVARGDAPAAWAEAIGGCRGGVR